MRREGIHNWLKKHEDGVMLLVVIISFSIVIVDIVINND